MGRGKTGSKGLVAFIDGGARGNPGRAGAGVYFELEGAPWRGLYQYLGTTTNNVAEYSALLRALEYALKEGFRELIVYSDSELLVRQILGQYRVKNATLKSLYDEAINLIDQMGSFAIHHIPRERNSAADALANRAQDFGEDGEEHF